MRSDVRFTECHPVRFLAGAGPVAIERLVGCERQDFPQRDFMLAPFEDERAAGLEDAEAFAESFTEHFLPAREEASIVFQDVTFSGLPFGVVRRVHDHMPERLIREGERRKIGQHIRLDLDPRHVLAALPRLLMLFLAAIHEESASVLLVEPHRARPAAHVQRQNRTRHGRTTAMSGIVLREYSIWGAHVGVCVLAFCRKNRLMTMIQDKSKSIVPLCISYALFALVLTPALFAISSTVSLRSIPTPSHSALGTVTHLIALVCIAIVPCILAVIGNHYWRWTALYAVASALTYFLISRFVPDANFAEVIRLPIGVASFMILFGLMISAATFGVFIRASYLKRNWIVFWVQVLAYIVVTCGAFAYLAIPLFVE